MGRNWMVSTWVCAVAACSVIGTVSLAADGTDEDRRAVEQAVLDYCDGFYEGNPELLERCLDQNLHKFGYAKGRDGVVKRFDMTYPEALELAKRYRKRDPDSPREANVLEVRAQIAAATLTAEWGVDFMHLHKVEGQWRIVHVVWQAPMPTPAATQPEATGPRPGGSDAPAFVAAPAAEPAIATDEQPLTTDQQKRFDAVALALVRAMNADDKAAYRALHSQAGWDGSIDWWQNLFAAQRARFGSIVRAYPCMRGLIRVGSYGFRASGVPGGASFVAIFEEEVGGVFTFALDGDGKISATSVFIKEELAAYDAGELSPLYERR